MNADMKKNVVKTRDVEVVQDHDPMIVRIVDRVPGRDYLRKSRKKAQKTWDRECESKKNVIIAFRKHFLLSKMIQKTRFSRTKVVR